MPLAATGLVICWNLPMNRARSSHSSWLPAGVCLSSSRSMKSNTSDGDARRPPLGAPDGLGDVAAIVVADRIVLGVM